MPVPEIYASKVTKTDFVAVAALANDNETGLAAAPATYSTVVEHGATAGTARPAGAVLVLWVGSVDPSNATTDDLLLRTDSSALFRYDGAAWDALGGGSASSVTFTPAGTIAATNTQAAVEEVATDAAAALSAHAAAAPHPAAGVRVGRSTALSLANNTDTAVDWDTEIFDTDGFWTSGAATRMTIPTGLGGLYVLTASCWFDANGTGLRQVRFRQNGSTILGWQKIPGHASGSVVPTSSVVCQAAAGDYFELMVYQDSGGNLNAGANAVVLNASLARLGA